MTEILFYKTWYKTLIVSGKRPVNIFVSSISKPPFRFNHSFVTRNSKRNWDLRNQVSHGNGTDKISHQKPRFRTIFKAVSLSPTAINLILWWMQSVRSTVLSSGYNSLMLRRLSNAEFEETSSLFNTNLWIETQPEVWELKRNLWLNMGYFKRTFCYIFFCLL